MKFHKILFVIPNMQQGGAERVVSIMANYWAEKANGISIITFDNKEPAYNLNPLIKVYKLNSAKDKLGMLNFLANNIIRVKNYFKFVRIARPDLIISFTDNANVYCILYNFFLRRTLIITQRTNPDYNTLPAILSRLPKLIYKYAGAIIVQTAETVRIYKRLKIKLPPVISIIHNPINKKLFANAGAGQRQNIVLAVGRLYNRDKHFDKLIEMFSTIQNDSWQLHIAGDGPDYKMLQDKIQQLQLTEKVLLLGSVNDLAPLYQRAKIFVLTSEFEGFPNALLEAMVNGCACISYDCPTGPSEIINHGENGILIKLHDEAAFAKQLSEVMENDEMIMRLSSGAVKIKDNFEEDKIMRQWEAVVDQLIK